MTIKNKSNLIIAILIPLAAGSLSAFIGGTSAAYMTFNKPSFAPPAILFPIVWTVLYILMGISSSMIYETQDANVSRALKVYLLQLAFNFFWSIIFFRFSLYFLAFIWIIVLIILIIIMIWEFYKISPLAAYLQIPYLLWCMFAAVLNYAIYAMN